MLKSVRRRSALSIKHIIFHQNSRFNKLVIPICQVIVKKLINSLSSAQNSHFTITKFELGYASFILFSNTKHGEMKKDPIPFFFFSFSPVAVKSH